MIKKGRKIAYLVSFILKLSMIVLFFLINGLSNAEIRLSESASFFQDETILVQTHNSGECTYNAISPGKIDISVRKNEHAGDVTIQVTVKDISYDDSYDREVVGNRMSEFKDLVPSKEGPWELCFQFALENKSFKNIISDTKSYDVIFNSGSARSPRPL